ncbi:hypothetical protein [Leptolyngbya ohadii]|uniref:hypothetical protein n=1 Tax=Leptolyngbya ohadii TaxID=1962290 RepID=UPI000B5A0D23|nr:hypothetical protein [Leptolyngbya ohadii]
MLSLTLIFQVDENQPKADFEMTVLDVDLDMIRGMDEPADSEDLSMEEHEAIAAVKSLSAAIL